MSKPQISDEPKHPWELVCEALGLSVRSRALPTTTTCPLCGHTTLRLFNDSVCTGAWHHCSHCNHCGDLVELAADAWGISRDAAGARCGITPKNLTRFDTELDARRGANALWQNASKDYSAANMPNLQKLRRAYNLLLPIHPEEWITRAGDLVGAADAANVRKIISGTVRQATFKFPSSVSPLTAKKERGGTWSNMILGRFESSPGRICVFRALANLGERGKDDVVVPVWPTADQNIRGKWEGGLYGVYSVLKSAHNQPVIAVNDWILALQCQLRSLRSSLTPMPIVAYQEHDNYRTRRAWQCLEGRQIVFWNSELDAGTLLQAAETNGRIVIGRWPDRNNQTQLGQFLRDHGESLYTYLLNRSKPWEQVFHRWLVKNQKTRAWLDMRESLDAAGADLTYIIQQIKQPLLSKQSLPVREIRVGQTIIVEKADRWTARSPLLHKAKNVEILNCTFIITHVITDTQDPQHAVYYYGRAAFNGQHVPFLERAETVRDKTAAWLFDLIGSAGLGAVAWSKTYADALHQIAIMFHTPVPVSEPVVKWRERLSSKPSRKGRTYGADAAF